VCACYCYQTSLGRLGSSNPVLGTVLETDNGRATKNVCAVDQFFAPLGAHTDDLKVRVTHLNRLKSKGPA